MLAPDQCLAHIVVLDRRKTGLYNGSQILTLAVTVLLNFDLTSSSQTTLRFYRQTVQLHR